jgi:aminopeptidase N
MLHALRQVMGDDRFFGACRDFYQARTGRATSTEELRSFWNASLGDDAALLDRWLETPGGVPSSK